ncbi:MAG TPA: hypothetical protein VGP47_10710, partial [Parachlamydiaceae bacterium]|nr:hypothetical protein [Parachlamydiaceae bacterium]
LGERLRGHRMLPVFQPDCVGDSIKHYSVVFLKNITIEAIKPSITMDPLNRSPRTCGMSPGRHLTKRCRGTRTPNRGRPHQRLSSGRRLAVILRSILVVR